MGGYGDSEQRRLGECVIEGDWWSVSGLVHGSEFGCCVAGQGKTRTATDLIAGYHGSRCGRCCH